MRALKMTHQVGVCFCMGLLTLGVVYLISVRF